ncbi:hypothetical protein E4T56_gene5313, partial [Termitomyces sp. T112]
MRSLNFSISKKSSLPPSISPAFAGRSRMRATTSVRQSPPPSRSGSGSCPTVSPATSQSRDILRLLEKHNIHDIDVAYHPITTALSLPISGLKTPYMQGTLGFFFHVGEELYGVTARHVLFPDEEGNKSYSYVAGPRKKVVLMGDKAFADFLASTQARIAILKNTVTVLGKQVAMYTKMAQVGNQQAVNDLATTEADLNKRKAAIEELKT